MPQLNVAEYPTQIFWLIVTFVPLYLFLWRVVLPRIGEVLEARQRHIDSDLEKATNLRQEAEQVLAEYEKALASARDDAAAAVKKAADEMAARSAERHEAFGKQLADRTREAEERIAEAQREAMGNLKAVANEIAAAATSKLIDVQPAPDEVERAVGEAMQGRS